MRRAFASLLFTNSTPRQVLLKNGFWLAAADGVSRLTKFLVILYVIRALGAVEFGKFAFAFAIVSLFSTLFDFGMSSVVTREFAKRRDEERSFTAILASKLVLGPPIICIVGVTGTLASGDSVVRSMVVVLALSLWISEYGATYYAFFRAHQRMEYESWIAASGAIGLGTVVLILMWWLRSIEALSYAYLVAAVMVLVGAGLIALWKDYPVVPRADARVWRRYVGMTAPIAMIGVVASIYRFGDSVMLGWLGLIEETGYYNAALRIVGLAIIPMNLVLPVFLPALSREIARPGHGMQRLFDKQMEIMIFVGVMVTSIVLPLAPRIVEVMFAGGFAPAASALQISIFTALLLYLWSPFNQLLIVCDRQGRALLVHLVGAALNVTLNLALIPKLGFLGASMSSVASELAICVLLIVATLRYVPIAFSLRVLGGVTIRALAAGTVVAVALYLVPGSGLGAVVAALIGGGIAYSGCFWGLRGVWASVTGASNGHAVSSPGSASRLVEAVKQSER